MGMTVQISFQCRALIDVTSTITKYLGRRRQALIIIGFKAGLRSGSAWTKKCLDQKVQPRTARSTNGQRVWRCGQPSMAFDTVRQAELAQLELENTQLWVFKGMLPGHFVLLV